MGKKKPSVDCCKKYEKKGQVCSDCPLMASLPKKKWRKLLAKHARR